MTVTRTFRWSGATVLLAVAMLVVRAVAGLPEAPLVPLGAVLLVLAGPVFAVSLTRHLLRGLLWRVESRLLVSYVLIALVPAPFTMLVAGFGLYAFSGQLAVRRVTDATEARIGALAGAAERLAMRLESAPASERKGIWEEFLRENAVDLPDLSVSWRARTEPPGFVSGPPFPPAGELPGWIESKATTAATWDGENGFFLAVVRRPGGRLVLALPLKDPLIRRLEAETDVDVETGEEIRGKAGKDEESVSISADDEGIRVRSAKPAASAASAAPPGSADESRPEKTIFADSAARPSGSGFFGSRWIVWGADLERPFLEWKSGERAAVRPAFGVRTAIGVEYRHLFGKADVVAGARKTSIGEIVVIVLRALGWTTLVVEILVTIIAAILVLRIARAVRRLSEGFAEIGRGNFGFRAALKGRDQLAELISGFNAMASHLEESVAARAEKETLQRELDLARDLQRRLLPSADFEFPGVEIATDFRPAAAIGGDFYHFLIEGPGRLVVVIADVSGHGLATGIVMASAKASLSALASTGADTVAILRTLDEEIRRTTDRRTFVTLAHTRLLIDAGRIELTNAGHLYPYRVAADGALSSLENPSRPLGVGLPAEFATVSAPLAPGDLWVFYSDGIVEATSAEGEQFGFERMERILRAGAGARATELRDRILAEWRSFTGHDEPEDDRTLLVVRILPRG